MNFQSRSPPVPIASTSTDTIQSHYSSTWGGGGGESNDFYVKKIELAKLNQEERKTIQLFRPGALRGDPSYRRIGLSAVEYMKDVKEQMIDDIQHQSSYAIEPPDTDAEQINNFGHFINESQQFVPRRKIAPEFLYRANPYQEADSTGTSPIDSANNSSGPISNYNDLILIASELGSPKVIVSKLKEFDLEPLFDHVRDIESKPSVFFRLQDVMKFIRGLEPPSPPQRSGTNVTSKTSSPFSSPPTSASSRRFSIPVRRRKMEESNISANELSDQRRQQLDTWERNFIWFIHTANILMGSFHGYLPYYWLNQEALNRSWEGVRKVKLPRVPTLEEFDRSRYSISAFPRIKYGIKVVGKEVSLQVLSLMDFRYRIEDKATVENHTIWNYYSESILKLSKLVPNKRSFDVAIDVGMIPEDMRSIVDFSWWTDNVIKFGREVEHSIAASTSEEGIMIGKETYELFDKLNKSYYNFFKTVRRDLWEQYKYNPVQLILNSITFLLTLAGVVFAVTGVIQVLQGFCYWEQYC